MLINLTLNFWKDGRAAERLLGDTGDFNLEVMSSRRHRWASNDGDIISLFLWGLQPLQLPLSLD